MNRDATWYDSKITTLFLGGIASGCCSVGRNEGKRNVCLLRRAFAVKATSHGLVTDTRKRKLEMYIKGFSKNIRMYLLD